MRHCLMKQLVRGRFSVGLDVVGFRERAVHRTKLFAIKKTGIGRLIAKCARVACEAVFVCIVHIPVGIDISVKTSVMTLSDSGYLDDLLINGQYARAITFGKLQFRLNMRQLLA